MERPQEPLRESGQKDEMVSNTNGRDLKVGDEKVRFIILRFVINLKLATGKGSG